jgi:hypothetical protein
LWQRIVSINATCPLENGLSAAHIRPMKNLAFRSSILVGAGIIALAAAYLAHTVLGMPRSAIRYDALGMAACLTAFIGAGMFGQWRDK